MLNLKSFRVQQTVIKARVAALKVPGGASISRKQIDDYTKYVSIYGAKGPSLYKN